MRVVEGLMEEKYLSDFQAECLELPAKLFERMRPKAARHEGTHMLGTKLHLDRSA